MKLFLERRSVSFILKRRKRKKNHTLTKEIFERSTAESQLLETRFFFVKKISICPHCFSFDKKEMTQLSGCHANFLKLFADQYVSQISISLVSQWICVPNMAYLWTQIVLFRTVSVPEESKRSTCLLRETMAFGVNDLTVVKGRMRHRRHTEGVNGGDRQFHRCPTRFASYSLWKFASELVVSGNVDTWRQ